MKNYEKKQQIAKKPNISGQKPRKNARTWAKRNDSEKVEKGRTGTIKEEFQIENSIKYVPRLEIPNALNRLSLQLVSSDYPKAKRFKQKRRRRKNQKVNWEVFCS